MGTSYRLGATIGYVISIKDLLEPFTVRTPEVSHMEQHFHPQTKLPLPPKKVVTQKAKVIHTIAGKNFEKYEPDAVEELARTLDFTFHYIGELGDPSNELVITSFAPDDLIDEGRFSFETFSFELDTSLDLAISLEPILELGEKLKSSGINVNKPKFTTYMGWC